MAHHGVGYADVPIGSFWNREAKGEDALRKKGMIVRKPATVGWYTGKTGSGNTLLCCGPVFDEDGRARVLTFLITGHKPPRTEKKLWTAAMWTRFANSAAYLGEIQVMPKQDVNGLDIEKLAIECLGRYQADYNARREAHE